MLPCKVSLASSTSVARLPGSGRLGYYSITPPNLSLLDVRSGFRVRVWRTLSDHIEKGTGEEKLQSKHYLNERWGVVAVEPVGKFRDSASDFRQHFDTDDPVSVRYGKFVVAFSGAIPKSQRVHFSQVRH